LEEVAVVEGQIRMAVMEDQEQVVEGQEHSLRLQVVDQVMVVQDLLLS
jgi:hypothetical protein